MKDLIVWTLALYVSSVSSISSSIISTAKIVDDVRRIPMQISYQELMITNQQNPTATDLQSTVLHALETVGMISITQVPNLNKEAILNSLPACLADVGIKSTLSDGTVRHTLALSTEPTTDEVTANHQEGRFIKDPTHVKSCQDLELLQASFRSTVEDVVMKFAEFLQSALSIQQTSLLQLDSDSQASLSIVDVVQKGEHLEHFHAYYSSPSVKEDLTNHHSELPQNTIEWHTDQGLLLAFSPGQVNGIPTDGFYIQLPDGSTKMMEFKPEDDIVIFFGDGVNQIINPILKEEGKNSLRVLPHSLQWSSTDSTSKLPRLWYGRMVLPPSRARHPLYPTLTFGDIRHNMIQNQNDFLALGCSSQHAHARLLGDSNKTNSYPESGCDESFSAYCWHSCMNYTEYDASPDLCESRKLQFGCVNEQGELWPDIHDPQYELRCVKEIITTTTTTSKNETTTGDHDDNDAHGTNSSTPHQNSTTEKDDADAESKAYNWYSASQFMIYMMMTLMTTLLM
jgi:hypothetical protein